MKLSKGKALKFIGIALVLLLLCICISTVSIFAHAYSTQSNIPVVSDLVEKIERRIVSDDQFREMVSKGVEESLDSEAGLQYLDGTLGYTSDFELTGEAMFEGLNYALVADGTMQNILEEKALATAMTTNWELEVEDLKLDGTLDVRGFQEDKTIESYYNLGDIPGILTIVMPELGQLSNKWIYIHKDIEEVYGSVGNGVFELDPKVKQSIIQFAYTKEFTNMFSRSSDRVIDNVRTRCVTIDANEDQLYALIDKYVEISGEDLALDRAMFAGMKLQAESCFGRVDTLPYYVAVSVISPEASVKVTLSNFKYSNDLVIEKPNADIDYESL